MDHYNKCLITKTAEFFLDPKVISEFEILKIFCLKLSDYKSNFQMF